MFWSETARCRRLARRRHRPVLLGLTDGSSRVVRIVPTQQRLRRIKCGRPWSGARFLPRRQNLPTSVAVFPVKLHPSTGFGYNYLPVEAMASFSEGIQLRRCLSFSGGAMQPSPPHKSTGPFNQRQTQLLGAKTVVTTRCLIHV